MYAQISSTYVYNSRIHIVNRIDASSHRFRKPSDRTFELISATFTKHTDYDRYTNSVASNTTLAPYSSPLCRPPLPPSINRDLSFVIGSPSAASPWRITWRRIYRTSRTPRSNTRWKCCRAARKPSYLCSSGWRPWTTTTIGTRGSSSWPSSSARSIASSVSMPAPSRLRVWNHQLSRTLSYKESVTVIGFTCVQSTRQTGRYETGLRGIGLVNGIKR